MKYDYGTHECLDRTYMTMELFSYVSQHPQIKANEEWQKMAGIAHSALYTLYNAIGETQEVDPEQ